MVNLILNGKANSNVHDGDIRLGDENGNAKDVKILKGIRSSCQFGFLSLFEHYKSLKVRLIQFLNEICSKHIFF